MIDKLSKGIMSNTFITSTLYIHRVFVWNSLFHDMRLSEDNGFDGTAGSLPAFTVNVDKRAQGSSKEKNNI